MAIATSWTRAEDRQLWRLDANALILPAIRYKEESTIRLLIIMLCFKTHDE